MELKAIIAIVVVVGIIGFILYRTLWDRIKGRRNKKQSDSSEPKEK